MPALNETCELSDEIEIKAKSISSKINNENGIKVTDDFGICNICKNAQFAKTEFAVVVARCYEYEIRLDTRYPIKECSAYYKKGQLTLYEMSQMATLIDVPKNKAGFIT